MDLKTALAMFTTLEAQRDTEFAGDPPLYDVRLDAKTVTEGRAIEVLPARTYTVRVTAAKGWSTFDRDQLMYVLEVAADHHLDSVDVENNAIVIS